LALNEYFLPRFLEIRSTIPEPSTTISKYFATISSNRTSSQNIRLL